MRFVPDEDLSALVPWLENPRIHESADIRAIFEECGAIELRTARDDAERLGLWAGRKGAFGAMGRVAPDLYVADACVPRTKLAEMVRNTVEIAKELLVFSTDAKPYSRLL